MKYAHIIFANRMLLPWLVMITTYLAPPASAIEKYADVPLPDMDRGSTARALDRAADGSYGLVGTDSGFEGPTAAMYWRIVVDPSDPSGNTVSAFELPKPLGSSAEVTGVSFLEGDPDQPIIVGSIHNAASGKEVAALWRRDGSAQFANTILDDEAS